MKSNIYDIDGVEVKEGDYIQTIYITPMGDIDYETLNETRHKVVFQHGCFGIDTDIEFVPLLYFQVKRQGEYISNRGNKVIYTGKYLFKKIKESKE